MRELRPVAVVAALVAALAGCADEPAPVADGVAPATGACEQAQRVQVQGGSHLLGDAEPPVPYSTDPPTSGWHRSGIGSAPGAYADPLSGPEQVSVLERGGVVLAFDPDLDGAERGALLELAGQVDGDLVVTPHTGPLPTPVTLTAWGVLQRCGLVTAADVTSFAAVHEGRVVDPD